MAKKKKKPMTTFVVLGTFDRAALAALMDDKREKSVDVLAEKVAAEAGSRIRDLWFTTGDYDMVAVVDAPDSAAALEFLVAFSGLGGVSTTSLTVAKAGRVIDEARAHTKMVSEG